MSLPHVHIHDGENHGVVYLDVHGMAHGDNEFANHFMHDLNHRGLKPEHGQALLDSIVKKLDRATLVSAHHCTKDDI